MDDYLVVSEYLYTMKSPAAENVGDFAMHRKGTADDPRKGLLTESCVTSFSDRKGESTWLPMYQEGWRLERWL
ncbi:hypothetical protein D1872_290900 [compost metagenome]